MDSCTNVYTNLFDSVIFNMDEYHAYEGIMVNTYKANIEKLCSDIAEKNIILGLTLNQISNNPFFFKQDNQKILENLINFISAKKAFVSTDGRSVKLYAVEGDKNGLLNLLGCVDKFYSSSDTYFVKNIKNGNSQRKAVTAYTGSSSNIRLSDNKENVILNGKEISFKDFLARYKDADTDKPGIMHAENNKKISRFPTSQMNEETYKELTILNSHINNPIWNDKATYKDNEKFVFENNLNILSVVNLVLENDELLMRIFNSTVDKTITPKKYEAILIKFKEAFASDIITGIKAPNRSKLYSQIDTICNDYLRVGWGITEKNYKNTKKCCYSFTVQFIDFCYNYFNSLLTFGVTPYEFDFYPYKTEKGHFIKYPEDNNNVIKISKNLFESKIRYLIKDTNGNCIGKYVRADYAKKAYESNPNERYVLDQDGYKIAFV